MISKNHLIIGIKMQFLERYAEYIYIYKIYIATKICNVQYQVMCHLMAKDFIILWNKHVLFDLGCPLKIY